MPLKLIITPLTSLRFFASFMIVIAHTNSYLGFPPSWNDVAAWTIGVPFFFVLSGYVLYLNYGPETKAIHAPTFVYQRFARIWPLHLVTMILALPFTVYETPMLAKPAFILPNLALVQSWIPVPPLNFSFNGVAWSLSVEWFFYCLFPFVSRRWWYTPLLLLPSAFAAWYLGVHLLPYTFDLNVPAISAWSFDWINPVFFMSNFGFGMLAAYLFRRLQRFRLSRPVLEVIQWTALALTVAVVIGNVAVIHAFIDTFGLYGLWLQNACLSLFFAAVFLAISFPGTSSYRALSGRILVKLGEISFSLYMVHFTVIKAGDLLLGREHPILFVPLTWAATLFAAWLLHGLVEARSRQILAYGAERVLALGRALHTRT